MLEIYLSLSGVIVIYAFIVWLLMKWNNEDIKR